MRKKPTTTKKPAAEKPAKATTPRQKKGAQTSEKQPVLLKPDGIFKILAQGVIHVDLLEHVDEPVDPHFQKYVAEVGVLQPILIVSDPEHVDRPKTIVGGRRRVKAARNAGLPEVPFIEFENMQAAMSYIATLGLNDHRRENILAEIHALQNLRALGLNERQIADAACVPISVVKRKLKLLQLNPDLMTGLEAGLIDGALCVKIAPLSEFMQAQLAAIFKASGKLTAKDVSGVKNVGRQKASKDSIENLDLDDDAETMTPRQISTIRMVDTLCMIRDEQGEEFSLDVNDILRNFAAASRNLLKKHGLDIGRASTLEQNLEMFMRECDIYRDEDE